MWWKRKDVKLNVLTKARTCFSVALKKKHVDAILTQKSTLWQLWQKVGGFDQIKVVIGEKRKNECHHFDKKVKNLSSHDFYKKTSVLTKSL